MSLKDFHIVFISAAVILAGWFSYWAYAQYAQTQTIGYIVTTIISFLITLGLIVYEVSFIRKTKKIH